MAPLLAVGRAGYFYPRSPCGERQPTTSRNNKNNVFLSTLSLRRATAHYDNYNLHCVISIHALLAESDRRPIFFWQPELNFYPRSPCGERLVKFSVSGSAINISIHALLAESDVASNFKHTEPSKFLSTLSLRRATVFIHSKHS